MLKMRTDLIFYASLIDSCISTKNLKKLREIHARILPLGQAYSDFIRCKLVAAYASCKQMHEAAFIFSCTNRCPPSLFNSMIMGYASIDLFHQSLHFFRQMLLAGKQPTPRTFPSVLKSCTGLSALHLGRQIHGAVLVIGFSSDLTISNALITLYSKCGDLKTSRKVFDEMPERNVITWSAIVAGYAMHGLAEEVFRSFDQMLVAGFCPDGVTFTSILTACSHGGLTTQGMEIFERMEREFGVKPGLEHYTCMVDMLGRVGQVEEAEKLIGGMEMEPDEALWNALLGACNIHGKLEMAERVAEKLYGRKVEFSND